VSALSQFSLLKSQRFFSLFILQFLGSCNGNILRNVVVVLITHQLVLQSLLGQQLLITLASGLFILSLFLFSALAGQLADKLNKKRLIITIKTCEVFCIALASLGFYLHSMGLLWVALFFMGIHGTVLSPVKYAILPDLLKKNRLLSGNALIEASIFMAIFLGALLGGLLAAEYITITLAAITMLCISILGLLASFYVPKTPIANPNLKINLHFIRASFDIIEAINIEKMVLWAILAISWFWSLAAIFVTQFPNFTKSILQANADVVTFFLGIFTVGVALGALIHNSAVKQTGLQWIPMSLGLMSVCIIDLYLTSHHLSMQDLQIQTHLSNFFYSLTHWRICMDLFGLSIGGGIYIVPLYTQIQTDTAAEHRGRNFAANNIVNAFCVVLCSLLTILLLKIDLTIIQIFLLLGLLNVAITLVAICLIPEGFIKPLLRWILKCLYDVKLSGLKNYRSAGESVVIVANHTSFLDVVLLYAFLPNDLLFAINRFTAKIWWIKPFLYFAKVVELDPLNPLAIKALIREVKKPGKCVIFPEGRITTTGALMKLYEGPGLIADHAKANLLPIRLQGAQYTPFSRLRGKVQIRWFPKISISILEPKRFVVDATTSSRVRRQLIGAQLYKVMVEMLFQSVDHKKTLFQSLLEARAIHKGPTKILEDVTRVPLSYDQLLMRCFLLGPIIDSTTDRQEIVGLLLPNMVPAVVVFFALQAYARVPALLNYAAGSSQLVSACRVARIRYIFTSKKFIELANLFDSVARLTASGLQFVYLEDIKAGIRWKDRLHAALLSRFAYYHYVKKLQHSSDTSDPAVVLFTSGSEGEPKGVVLSHENIQANLAQMTTQLDFNQKDIFFSALPLFHAFGLTACVILPIYHGTKTFIYPSPLHYRKVPNMIYECNATITFGTDTFLAGYGRYAHPYDFYSIRYVFAGAEKLKEKTKKLWMEKFGIRIFEGYGVTEASPVISLNTPMQNKPGTVGKFLPGINYTIEPVTHIKEGGRLLVSGPNIMLGYLNAKPMGEIVIPHYGWYDTGDIVEVDADGYLTVKDRAKRFAKISGEMISLTAVENAIYDLWPDNYHAVISLPDARKGEQLILITNYPAATRNILFKFYQKTGLSELSLPRRLYFIEAMPLLSSGKVDYEKAKIWLEKQV